MIAKVIEKQAEQKRYSGNQINAEPHFTRGMPEISNADNPSRTMSEMSEHEEEELIHDEEKVIDVNDVLKAEDANISDPREMFA